MEMFRLAKLLKTYFFLKKLFFFTLGLIFWMEIVFSSQIVCFVNIEDGKVTLIIVQFTFPHFSVFFRMKLL